MRAPQSMLERLSTGAVLVGLLQTQPNLTLAELAGMCGYDFLFLDAEHGVFSEADYLHTLQVLRAVDALALIRLPQQSAPALGRYLDMGADALVAPNVISAEHATALVRAMVYPPLGTRGFSAPVQRTTRYGLQSLSDHLQDARGGALLIVMIESARGLANVEEIAAVEGVDGVFIGPADLSMDLACPGDFTQTVYREAVARIETATRRHKKWLGTAPHAGNPVDSLVTRGHRLLLLGADMSLVRAAMSEEVARARALAHRGLVPTALEEPESALEQKEPRPYG